jgi:hypothetical protein
MATRLDDLRGCREEHLLHGMGIGFGQYLEDASARVGQPAGEDIGVVVTLIATGVGSGFSPRKLRRVLRGAVGLTEEPSSGENGRRSYSG